MLTQKLLYISVLLLLAISFGQQLSISAEYPTSFQAKSMSSGGKTHRVVIGSVTREVFVRSKSVGVEINSIKKPDIPYLIECFFIARSEESKEKWVYDAVVEKSYGNFDKLTLTSMPLRGTESITTRVEVPMLKITQSSSFYKEEDGGTAIVSVQDAISGDRIIGWIVRCRSEGKVVAIKASSVPDLTFAKNHSKRLD